MDTGYFDRRIRNVPDWPEPGVMFRDITPLLRDGEAFRSLIDTFAERYADAHIDAVAGIDARGFIIGVERIPTRHHSRGARLPPGLRVHTGAQGRQTAV